MHKIFYLTICFLLCLVSCKKEGDELRPSASFLYPDENTRFNVFDTLKVSGRASDETRLASVDINIINEDQISISETKSIPVSGRDISFSDSFILNDIHIPSGTYYIHISAFDGSNVTHAYRKIYITEAPLKRKGFYLISSSGSQVNVSFADSLLNISAVFNLPGDYSGSAISSYYQQLYVSGYMNGSFKAFSLIDNSLKYSIAPISSSEPNFTSVNSNSSKVFLSYYDRKVSCMDGGGNIISTVLVQEGYYPVHSFSRGSNLLVEEKEIGSNMKKIAVYYTSTGAGIQEINIDFDVVSYFEKDIDNIYILGNLGNQGVLKIYNISGNYIWTPHALSAAKMLSAAQIDSYTLLIAMDDNSVYKYQYSNNNLVPFIPGIKASDIKYEPLYNEVIIAEGIKLNLYDYVSASLKSAVFNSDTIKNIHILYNK